MSGDKFFVVFMIVLFSLPLTLAGVNLYQGSGPDDVCPGSTGLFRDVVENTGDTPLEVSVSSSGEFSNLELDVPNVNVGGNVKFAIPVVADAGFDLASIEGSVVIYDKVGERVDGFDLEPVKTPGGVMRLSYDWKADVEVGEYVARAEVSYGGGVILLEESFGVGNEELELQEIRADDFELGKVSKVEMLIENMWGVPVSDAFIESEVLDGSGRVVSSFKSLNYDIGALRKEVFVSYWDSEGVSKGNYDVEVSIRYGDKSIRKSLSFEVGDDELIVGGIDYVASIDSSGDYNLVVIILVVVLVVINLVWFFMLRNKSGKSGK